MNYDTGTNTIDGSTLYIISKSLSPTIGKESIKIQTKSLSTGNPSSNPGSIQVAAESSIDLISRTGIYYMGNRTDTGLTSSILPTKLDSSTNKYLMLDEVSGRIYREDVGYTDISSSVSFGAGITSATKVVKLYNDGTVIASFYKTSGTSNSIGVYGDILSNLPASSSPSRVIFRARYGPNNIQSSNMSHADISVSGTSITNGISVITFGYLEFTVTYKKA